MSKHTPGPWRVYPAGSSVPGYDVCDRIVADVMTNRSAHEGPSDADACLIAAAPDLLEAARAVLHAFEDGTFGVDGNRGFNMLRAAIAKAEGRS